MNIQSIKNKLKKTSKKDIRLDRTKYRKEKKDLLDIFFTIAVKVISTFK